MANSKKINKVFTFIYVIFTAICISVLLQLPLLKTAYAQSVASNEVAITNSDFDSSSSTALQSTPNGWSKQGTSTGKSGIISTSDETFSNRASSYALSNTKNPDVPYTIQGMELDDHVLMINANSTSTSNESNHMGYKSNTIGLESYSYYKLSIWTLTQEDAVASIYIDGFDADVKNTSFERYSSTVWTEYRFYFATGIDQKDISIELWLGSKEKDSKSAVFFDHVTMYKISGNYFEDEINNTFERKNVVDLRDYETPLIENADFEIGDKTGWKVIGYMPTNSNSKIVGVDNRASMESLGIEYLGSSLSPNNNFAFVLYSTSNKAVSLGYESTPFNVLPYETYKITVWAKISSNFNGKAQLVLQEGDDVSNFYGEEYKDFYTPVSKTIDITSNTTNTLTNNYTPYYFYVKGHDLFETSFTLQLWLGTSKEGATGSVIFDDISFEKISWSNFDNAETTNSATLSLSTTTGSPSVANGTFNSADALEKNFEYPVTPSDWTSHVEDASKAVYGIINTYSPFYEANKSNFGGAKNPNNPTGSAGDIYNDVNNVLMLYNKQATYQSVMSQELTTTKESYQKISFDYKTILQSTNNKLMNVYILDEDDNVLFSDEGIYNSNWSKYELLIRSTTYQNTFKLVISLGNENNPVSGFLYIDNVKFETDSAMTDDLYENYVQVNKSLDFNFSNFNFVSPDQNYGMYTPYRYEQNLEIGDVSENGDLVAYGGIIDGDNNIFGITNSENNTEVLKYMPAFKSNTVSKYTLTAKETLSFEAGKYYKLSVDIYTRFSGNLEQPEKDEDEKLKYGALFSLKGIDKQFETIVSNDKWTTYTMYLEVSETTDANLVFGILNESAEIQGQAFFDSLSFETVEKTEYDQAKMQANNDSTLLVVTAEEATATDDDEVTNPNDTDMSTFWYLVPSLIMFVALVIALSSYFMKKVTIKKWERKRVNEFDRNSTLYRDVVRQEAEQIRDSKIKELEKEIGEIEQKIAKIEQQHKENLKKQKQTVNRSVTREAERDFKAYAQKHTKLENQIESIKAKIETLNMPEYLLSVQRSIILEKIKKEKQSKEAEIKKNREQKKLQKKANKD